MIPEIGGEKKTIYKKISIRFSPDLTPISTTLILFQSTCIDFPY